MPVKVRPIIDFENMWRNTTITNEKKVAFACKKVLEDLAMGQEAERLTGLPWALVLAISWQESTCNDMSTIANGQRWDKVTTLVPKQEGPYGSWAEAAKHSIDDHNRNNRHIIPDMLWTPSKCLFYAESWNGWAYYRRGLNSPYICTFTNFETPGRYVGDGQFDPKARGANAGVLAVLWYLHYILKVDTHMVITEVNTPMVPITVDITRETNMPKLPCTIKKPEKGFFSWFSCRK